MHVYIITTYYELNMDKHLSRMVNAMGDFKCGITGNIVASSDTGFSFISLGKFPIKL